MFAWMERSNSILGFKVRFLSVLGDIADLAGRVANDDHVLSYIPGDDCACTNDRATPDADARQDNGASTNECAVLNRHFAGQPCAWGDMRAISNHTVMIYGRGCVDDDGTAKFCIRTDRSEGQNLRAFAECGGGRDERGSMDDGGQEDVMRLKEVGNLQPTLAVGAANGNGSCDPFHIALRLEPTGKGIRSD